MSFVLLFNKKGTFTHDELWQKGRLSVNNYLKFGLFHTNYHIISWKIAQKLYSDIEEIRTLKACLLCGKVQLGHSQFVFHGIIKG